MLSIILFILKLIGIILAFIVVLITLVLLVPIRYNIYANYKEDIFGEFKVHWLLHFLHFKGVYTDNNLRMKLRILGLVVYDSDKVKKNLEEEDSNIDNKLNDDKKTKKDKRHKKDKKSKKDIQPKEDIKIKLSPDEISVKDDISTKKVVNIQKESINEKLLVEKDNINENNLLKEVQNNNTINDSKDEENLVHNNENIKLLEDTLFENVDNKENPIFKKIKSILRKIKNIILKIYIIPNKVKTLFSKFGKKYREIKVKLSNIGKIVNRIKSAIEKIKLFLHDEVNKDGMKHIFKGLKSILWHIKPQKITGNIEFGAKDPFETGQILAIISMGYGLYGKSFNIYPNFEEEVLNGNIKVVGRIRLITLLIIGIKLILYKNNRQLVKNIMVLKEEL